MSHSENDNLTVSPIAHRVPFRDLVENPLSVSVWTYRKWSPNIARIFRYARMKTLGDVVEAGKQKWLDEGFTPEMMMELEKLLKRFGLELKE